jgi:hypothetical protein
MGRKREDKSGFWYRVDQNNVAEFGFKDKRAGSVWLPWYTIDTEASIALLHDIRRDYLKYWSEVHERGL